ncbi:MAG TPA: enoyl-CoA hydratase/isomerase family protein [Dehalococcoidia bacterium]
MSGSIAVTIEGSIATLVIDNPGQRNALTPEMLRDIATQLGRLGDADAVRVAVLQGRGAAFSSGYALDKFPTGDDLGETDDIDVACEAIERSRLVVIALIQGPCVGAALEVAASCDFRFAEANAGLGITPVKFGLVYKWRGIERIYRLVGPSHARELFFTGQLISAERAERIGLVNEVCADGPAVERRTYEFAEQLGGLAPIALAGNKWIFCELERLTTPTKEVRSALHRMRCIAIDSKDAIEARKAFAEKRAPKFTGS